MIPYLEKKKAQKGAGGVAQGVFPESNSSITTTTTKINNTCITVSKI
jgi:hypothetical protein